MLRTFKNTYQETIFAAPKYRAEAKILLFRELSKAASIDVSMEQALGMISQKAEENWISTGRPFSAGPENRHFLIKFFYLIVIVFGYIPMLLYAAFSHWNVDLDLIAQKLARRLHKHVAKGMAFSEAMEKCGLDYSEQEVALARSGEESGQFAEALSQIANMQLYTQRVSRAASLILYPFFIVALGISLITFMTHKIIPKFVDIYAQMGAEIPPFTATFIRLSHGPFPSFFLLVSMLFSIFFALWFCRVLMNGSGIGKLFIFVTITGFSNMIVIGAILSIAEQSGGNLRDLMYIVFAVILVFALLSFVLSIYLIRGIEHYLLKLEYRFKRTFHFLPLIRRGWQTQMEAVWTSSLALGLKSGMETADAVMMACQITGGRVASRGPKVQKLCQEGHTIGEACRKANLLRPQQNERIFLAEKHDNFIHTLESFSLDMYEQAKMTHEKAQRVIEISTTILISIITFGILLAMYLPIFYIPNIVINQN